MVTQKSLIMGLSVQRDWIANAQNVINVKRFGAVGDGVTDDQPAIQQAIDRAEVNGGVIFFPVGNYHINASRLIYSSVKAIAFVGSGWGSILTWTDATDSPTLDKGMLNISGTGSADVDHCVGVEIRDLNFQFGGNNGSPLDLDLRGVNIYSSDNIRVSGCRFEGGKAEMLAIGVFGNINSLGKRSHITSCFFADATDRGCRAELPNSIIIGNFFHDVGIPIRAGGGGPGIIIIGNDMEDTEEGMQIVEQNDFVIRANRFKDADVTGVIHSRISRALTAVTTQIEQANNYMGVDTETNAVTLTLPTPHKAGQEIIVKDETGNAATLNITITSVDDIDDVDADITMSADFGVVILVSDGTNWFLLKNGAI